MDDDRDAAELIEPFTKKLAVRVQVAIPDRNVFARKTGDAFDFQLLRITRTAIDGEIPAPRCPVPVAPAIDQNPFASVARQRFWRVRAALAAIRADEPLEGDVGKSVDRPTELAVVAGHLVMGPEQCWSHRAAANAHGEEQTLEDQLP